MVRIENWSRRWFIWIAFAIVMVSLGIRLWDLGHNSLWIDEIWTDSWMEASFGESLDLILENAVQPPLYFSIMYPFPNDGENALRLPSALMGAGGVALSIWLCAILYERRFFALLIGAMLAVNPYHIWLSRTARPYPLVFILSLLAFYFFLRLLQGRRTRSIWIGFVLSSMAAYLTHYFTVALPIAQYVMFGFVLRTHRRLFRQWMMAQTVAVVPVMIWIFLLTQQEVVSIGVGWIPTPALADLPLTLWNMSIGYDGHWHWYALPGLVAAGIGLSVGVRASIRNRRKDRTSFFWVVTIVAPWMVAFVVSLFRPLYVDRYFVVFLPALLLTIAWGWCQLPDKRVGIALAVVFLATNVMTVASTISNGRDEKEDWRGVASYIEQGYQAGDKILSETPVDLLAMLYYVEDDDSLEYSWLLDNPDIAAFVNDTSGKLWVIYRNQLEDGHIQGELPTFDPLEESGSPLDDWLPQRQSQITVQQPFNGVTVLVLDMDSGPRRE